MPRSARGLRLSCAGRRRGLVAFAVAGAEPRRFGLRNRAHDAQSLGPEAQCSAPVHACSGPVLATTRKSPRALHDDAAKATGARQAWVSPPAGGTSQPSAVRYAGGQRPMVLPRAPLAFECCRTSVVICARFEPLPEPTGTAAAPPMGMTRSSGRCGSRLAPVARAASVTRTPS